MRSDAKATIVEVTGGGRTQPARTKYLASQVKPVVMQILLFMRVSSLGF